MEVRQAGAALGVDPHTNLCVARAREREHGGRCAGHEVDLHSSVGHCWRIGVGGAGICCCLENRDADRTWTAEIVGGSLELCLFWEEKSAR